MQRTRFPWYLGVAIVVAILFGISATAVSAATTSTSGATLRASGETVSINKRGIYSTRQSRIESGGSEDFVGNGFGPGEVVSLYITFPDGRVFPVINESGTECCAQTDEMLADGTGSFFFSLVFDITQQYPTTTGSATDGTQFTDNIFALPPEFAAGVPPYGSYTVTALGRVSLQKAPADGFRSVRPPPQPG